MSSLRAWLTGRPKSSRATCMALWLGGNLTIVISRSVPKGPTLAVLNWVIGASCALLLATIGYVALTQRRRK